ncbi:MAG: type II toxin-antitoxin system RelE/ParE family toxin [Chloroflexota bacterium]
MSRVLVSARAQRDLGRIDRRYLGAVANALRRLADAPLSGKALTGDLGGLRSLRVGAYRAVYRFDPRSQIVEVVWIRHRREVYR